MTHPTHSQVASPSCESLSGESAKGPTRLAGIDLVRILAAFSVIGIHVGLVFESHATAGVALLQNTFSLSAVPLFLATAFYFAMPRPDDVPGPLRTWLGKRAWRLLVPYGAWTLIYTLAQAGKFLLINHDPTGLSRLSADLLGRILLGNSGVHLYFIPLLFAGLVLARLMLPLLSRSPLIGLLVLFLAALAGSEWLIRSSNGFDLSTTSAFRSALAGPDLSSWASFPPMRLCLVFLAHAIRCLPFIVMTAVLVRLGPTRHWSIRVRTTLIVTSIAILLAGHLQLTRFPEALIGGSGVILGLAVSPWFSQSAAASISRLGVLTFPIYLVHQFPLEAFQILLRYRVTPPAGPGSAIAVIVASFAASWSVAHAIQTTRNRFLYAIFGIAPIIGGSPSNK